MVDIIWSHLEGLQRPTPPPSLVNWRLDVRYELDLICRKCRWSPRIERVSNENN